MNTPNRTQWTGLFRALVIDDRDPLFKMRVKVRIPDFMVADEQKVGKWGSNGLWASPGNNFLGGRSIQDTQKRYQGHLVSHDPVNTSKLFVFDHHGKCQSYCQ